MQEKTYESAVFGGGCFWCTETVFLQLKGIKSVTPGYTGGSLTYPTYEQVSAGNTGHVEAVKIEFDPSIISYDDLLAVFFNTHDPTTLDRQGNDVGSEYNSAIFYTDEVQKKQAKDLIAELNETKSYDHPVITSVRPFEVFYEAEDYHKRFYEKYKDSPYCKVVIAPKLEKLEKRFKRLLRLSAEEYKVLREKGTEAPFSGKLLHDERSGMYICKVCGNELFLSESKFDSGTGWPSFDEALPGAVELVQDNSGGMIRTEVVCANCRSHLGHLFNDGPTPTGKRYCLNSVCLELEPEK